jgi:hypothetical protein
MQENNIKSDNNNTQEEKIINDSNINANQMEKTKFFQDNEKILKSKNYISKANFFSKSLTESPSDNSNDETSCVTNKTYNNYFNNYSNKSNLLYS